jgi:hypothetical protein
MKLSLAAKQNRPARLRWGARTGTDQHVARGRVPDYTQWVHLAAAMLRNSFAAEKAGKPAGGNYTRFFRVAVG